MEFRIGKKIQLKQEFVNRFKNPPSTPHFVIVASVDDAISIKSESDFNKTYTIRMYDIIENYVKEVKTSTQDHIRNIPIETPIKEPVIEKIDVTTAVESAKINLKGFAYTKKEDKVVTPNVVTPVVDDPFADLYK
jgi:hypothetical protein